MKITPLEIKQKSFTIRTFGKGFDRDEVQAFLLTVAQEWEKSQDEKKEFSIRIELLEKELQKQKEVENSLYRTLKTAEDTGANILDQARRQADTKVQDAQHKANFILQEARLQAKQIVQKAQQRATFTLEDMIKELKSREKVYKDLETYKDDFLISLKAFMQENTEKLQKFEEKNRLDYFQQKIQDAETSLEEQYQTSDQLSTYIDEQVEGQENFNLDTPPTERKASENDNFFEYLK